MRIRYDKLVRDGIPEIIRKAGKTSSTRIADDEDYRALLEAIRWHRKNVFRVPARESQSRR